MTEYRRGMEYGVEEPEWWYVDEPVHKSGPALAAVLLTVPLVLGTVVLALIARRR